MTKKTTAAQNRATNTYRGKTIKKEVTVNPENYPRLAEWITAEQYKQKHGKSFNQFAIDLFEAYLDSDDSEQTK